MSYNSNQTKTDQQNENAKRINLDEVIEDEFNLSKKKKPMNDSKSEQTPNTKINLNENM